MATPLTAEIIDLGNRLAPEFIEVSVFQIAADVIEINTGSGGGGGSTRPASGFLYPRGNS